MGHDSWCVSLFVLAKESVTTSICIVITQFIHTSRIVFASTVDAQLVHCAVPLDCILKVDLHIL